jgi:large conductance mechanosensitive channel
MENELQDNKLKKNKVTIMMSKEKVQRIINREKVRQMKDRAGKNATDFWVDFRKFAFQGNVIDLAVGIIIGGAFNKIVQSLTNDIIMPIFGKLLGNVAFSDLYINLSDKQYATFSEAVAAGAPIIKYGQFINNILDFLIIALSLYVFLKVVLRKKQEEEKK